jgi:hypothetical protein
VCTLLIYKFSFSYIVLLLHRTYVNTHSSASREIYYCFPNLAHNELYPPSCIFSNLPIKNLCSHFFTLMPTLLYCLSEFSYIIVSSCRHSAINIIYKHFVITRSSVCTSSVTFTRYYESFCLPGFRCIFICILQGSHMCDLLYHEIRHSNV